MAKLFYFFIGAIIIFTVAVIMDQMHIALRERDGDIRGVECLVNHFLRSVLDYEFIEL